MNLPATFNLNSVRNIAIITVLCKIIFIYTVRTVGKLTPANADDSNLFAAEKERVADL